MTTQTRHERETWGQLQDRHKREKRALVQSLAAERITQTEAASRVGMSLQGFNNLVQRFGIYWPVKQQGKKVNA